MNCKFCVIGSEAFLYPFLQFGFAVYTPPSERALRDYLQRLIRENYGVVYIEDAYCFQVRDILDKHRNALTPIFVPLGENKEGDSYSRRTLNELMSKAIGQNIL